MDAFALFTTPVFVFRPEGVDDLNAVLTRTLVTESQSSLGVQRSNYGGWHSAPDLAHRQGAAFQRLMGLFREAVDANLRAVAEARGVRVPRGYGHALQAWAMVMQRGDYSTVHDHAEAHFSAVYYADAGDSSTGESAGGALTFVDGRRGSTVIPGMDYDPTEFVIRPETGALVVFPGWLQHYVHPYRGRRPRVSIAANLRLVRDETAHPTA